MYTLRQLLVGTCWHVVVSHSGKLAAAVNLFVRSSKFALVIATKDLCFSMIVAWPLQRRRDCDRANFGAEFRGHAGVCLVTSLLTRVASFPGRRLPVCRLIAFLCCYYPTYRQKYNKAKAEQQTDLNT